MLVNIKNKLYSKFGYGLDIMEGSQTDSNSVDCKFQKSIIVCILYNNNFPS
jgi:hypothetical protein